MEKAGENFIGIPEREAMRSDIPLHVCLSNYFKDEFEKERRSDQRGSRNDGERA